MSEFRRGPGALRGPLLAIDTATKRAAVAVGDGAAAPIAARSWAAGYRHGEELLAAIEEIRQEAGIALEEAGGVVVGTGPGAFTGLRVGLATAKALAYGLRVPIVGVPSAGALAVAALERPDEATPGVEVVVLMPAGPHDRYLARYLVAGGPGTSTVEPIGDPELVPGRDAIDERIAGAIVVAVDLEIGPSVPGEAVARGAVAQDRLGASLLALGRSAFEAGRVADVAELVPAYVTLPRGISQQVGAIEWSRDLR